MSSLAKYTYGHIKQTELKGSEKKVLTEKLLSLIPSSDQQCIYSDANKNSKDHDIF